MERDVVVLLLRLALVIVLYVFLFQLLVVLWRDLRQPAESPRPEQPSGPALEVVTPGGSGRPIGEVIRLQAVNSLGRSQQNAIVLADPSVSGEHALLSYRLGQWWIEDVGSTNGTFINNVRIDQPTIVTLGDVIGLGLVRLRFRT